MDLTSLPIFQMLQKKMTWLTNRQQVISENLANADTPGYQTKTLKEPDFAQYLGGMGGSLGVETTSAKHFDGASGAAGSAATVATDTQSSDEGQVSPTGNSVNLTEEAMKIADTRMQYNMATNLYRKHVQMLRLALGRQGG